MNIFSAYISLLIFTWIDLYSSSTLVAACATFVISYIEEFFSSDVLSCFLRYLRNTLGNLVDIYLIEDARKAVQALSNQSIDVFCVGLETAGKSCLEKIFGRRNFSLIDRVEQLPLKLPSLYIRMTS